MLSNCLAVLACGITFAFFPAIMGIFLGKVVHVVVAKGLCQDAGSSDGKIFAVTLHYGGVGQATVGFEPVSVHYYGLRSHCELVKSTVHGKERSIQNVYAVDFLWRHHTHSPCHSIANHNFAQGIALLFGQFLRVIEQGILIVLGQNDSSGIYTASEASTSCLVTARFYHAFMIIAFQHTSKHFHYSLYAIHEDVHFLHGVV